MLNDLGGFVFDLDGLVFKDEKFLKGLKELIEILKTRGLSFVFLSNLSAKSFAQLHNSLLEKGVYVKLNQIITGATLVKEYLKTHCTNENIKVFGSQALKSFVYEEYRVGVNEVDILVVGMEPTISLSDLSKMKEAIKTSKKVIFTNADYYTPTSINKDFDCGVIIKVLKPYLKDKEIILGKPFSFALEYAIKRLEVPKEYVGMVSCDKEDIEAAKDIGMYPIYINDLEDSDSSYKDLDAICYELLNFELLLNSKLKREV